MARKSAKSSIKWEETKEGELHATLGKLSARVWRECQISISRGDELLVMAHCISPTAAKRVGELLLLQLEDGK